MASKVASRSWLTRANTCSYTSPDGGDEGTRDRGAAPVDGDGAAVARERAACPRVAPRAAGRAGRAGEAVAPPAAGVGRVPAGAQRADAPARARAMTAQPETVAGGAALRPGWRSAGRRRPGRSARSPGRARRPRRPG